MGNRAHSHTSAAAAAAKSFQSCLTLRDPIDSTPPGSPVPGILQARTLEWGAIAFSESPPGRHINQLRLLKRLLHYQVCENTFEYI